MEKEGIIKSPQERRSKKRNDFNVNKVDISESQTSSTDNDKSGYISRIIEDNESVENKQSDTVLLTEIIEDEIFKSNSLGEENHKSDELDIVLDNYSENYERNKVIYSKDCLLLSTSIETISQFYINHSQLSDSTTDENESPMEGNLIDLDRKIKKVLNNNKLKG